MIDDLQRGVNLILDRYAYSGVAFSSAKVLLLYLYIFILILGIRFRMVQKL